MLLNLAYGPWPVVPTTLGTTLINGDRGHWGASSNVAVGGLKVGGVIIPVDLQGRCPQRAQRATKQTCIVRPLPQPGGCPMASYRWGVWPSQWELGVSRVGTGPPGKQAFGAHFATMSTLITCTAPIVGGGHQNLNLKPRLNLKPCKS